MSPKELYEFLQEVKSSVEGINKAWLVVDDSQLGNTLEGRNRDDNAYLVGVLPSYGSRGRNDAVQDTMVSQLLVLEKVDYSDLSEEEFVVVFERTFRIAKEVKAFLIEKMGSGCYVGFGDLDVNNLEMQPIWKKSQCNGWSIEFSLE